MENFNFSLNDLNIQIGSRFKQFRDFLGLKQSEIADILGLTQATIAGIEKGKSFPTIPALIILLEKYDLSVPWLLTGKGNMIAFKIDGKKNHGEYESLMDDFLFHIENVDMVRFAMLGYFIGYKEQNKSVIESLLKQRTAKTG